MSTTIQPLFIDDAGASRHSRFDRLIVQMSGTSCGPRIIVHNVVVKHDTAHKKADVAGVFAPAELPQVKEYAKLHNAGVWSKLQYQMIPGPGMYGRTCTVHFGWSSLGMEPPTTMEEFQNLAGYTEFSFGGVTDISSRQVLDSGPFNQDRDSVVFCRKFKMGTECRLYWFAEVGSIGTVQGAGSIFSLSFRGEIEVYGNVLS